MRALLICSMLCAGVLPVRADSHLSGAAAASQGRSRTDFTCQRVVQGGDALAREIPVTAGDLWQQPRLDLQFSYAEFDDDTYDGGGEHSEGQFTLSGGLAERWHLSLTAGAGRYSLDSGPNGLDLDDTFITGIALYEVAPRWSVGPFIEGSHVDVETDFGEDRNENLLAAGLLSSYSFSLHQLQVGLTGALASMNKEQLPDLVDAEDTAVAAMLDLSHPLGERFRTGTFAYYFSLLDSSRPGDERYWQVGADLTWLPAQDWDVRLGYSTYLDNDSYDEDRLTLAVGYWF